MDEEGRDEREAGETPDRVTALVLQMTAALVADPPTELTIINVADEAGTVTLSGRVSDPRFRALAEKIAAGYPGVSRTANDLEVAPPPRDRGYTEKEDLEWKKPIPIPPETRSIRNTR